MTKPALFALAFALMVSISVPNPASALLHKRDAFPACTDQKVLDKLVKRFNKTEEIYWQARGLVLSKVHNPHKHSINPFPDSPINRRYCHGDAVFENGKKRRVHFLIEQGAGFAGFTWNVEYCVHGLDPWRYYDGYCRVLSR